VRELENEIERLWVLSGDDRLIDEELLTPSIRGASRTSAVPGEPIAAAPAPELGGGGPAIDATGARRTLPAAVEMLERAMIVEELRRAKGNKTRAAEELGISRRNLIRKVQAYGLEPGAVPGAKLPGDDEET
jgi:DNA-binding NtrC family response regulator